MIYFLQPVSGGPVKIGFTENLDVRLKALESHYGQPLAILAALDGDRERERELHRQFAHLRLGRTEQFQPAADLLAFIGRPLLVSANPDAVETMPVAIQRPLLNLKGTREQADWLDAIHRKTHLPRSIIVRLALSSWAIANGHPAFPFDEDVA